MQRQWMKLEAYEKAHPKMTSMAKLFCLKIEWLLKKETASPQVLYELACEAVCCTVKEAVSYTHLSKNDFCVSMVVDLKAMEDI